MSSYHHGNLREELIKAGIQYICENGNASLSLRKISKNCGVTHTAAYSHFVDKEAFLDAMRDYVTLQFIESSKKAILPCKNEKEKFTMLGRSYVEFFANNPYFYIFLFQRIDIKVNLNNLRDSDDYPPFEMFKTSALSVMETLHIPVENQLQNILAMWGIVHGLAGISAMNAVQYQGNWGELTTRILSENILIKDMRNDINKKQKNDSLL